MAGIRHVAITAEDPCAAFFGRTYALAGREPDRSAHGWPVAPE